MCSTYLEMRALKERIETAEARIASLEAERIEVGKVLADFCFVLTYAKRINEGSITRGLASLAESLAETAPANPSTDRS